MPFLRFIRDKRGYENTYVVHTSRRRGGQSRSGILYWFRTPPNVRVGRSPLDEEAIREIEERHPDLTFDWERILKAQPPAPSISPRPDRRGGRRRRREPAAVEQRRAVPVSTRIIEPQTRESASTPLPPAAARAEEAAGREALVDSLSIEEEPRDALPVPAASLVERLVGAENLGRLKARHAELLARISARISDPGRRDALRASAERLDPDGWVTEAEARERLAAFDSEIQALQAQLGRRRRRGRRGGRGRRRGGTQPAQPVELPNSPQGSTVLTDDQPEEKAGRKGPPFEVRRAPLYGAPDEAETADEEGEDEEPPEE